MPPRFPIAPIVAGAAVGAAGLCAYAALSAGSQLFGPTLVATRDPNRVALTFDDGPNDPYTLRLLDILAERQVRSTFFMIGRFARQRPEIVRAVQAAGHLVGNHTMTHPWLVVESPAKARRELADCNAALEDVLGAPVRYFRPPHGARRPDVLRAARELGLEPVMWNAIGYDWRPGIRAPEILAHLDKAIARNRRGGRGTNIVLHDGGHAQIGADRAATVEAVRRLLPRLLAEKASFVAPDGTMASQG